MSTSFRIRRIRRIWPVPAALAALALLVFAAAGFSRAPAATALPAGALAPTALQRALAPRIAAIFEHDQYLHLRPDAQFSARVLHRYLEMLDPGHSYFLASDIASFNQWRPRFAQMLDTGDLNPAFDIFAVFQQRNRERLHYALQVLSTEPDWSTDQTYDIDRRHAPWPADPAAMNSLWRRRVENDAISLMLAGKTWPQAQKVLRQRYRDVLEQLGKIEPEDVFEAVMNAFASSFDPHSSYFSPRSSEEYRIQMSLTYQGIGASLKLSNDYVTVASIIPGGPAQNNGTLKVNDRITAVGQGRSGPMVDVVGWRLGDVVQLIRGKGGTVVRLQILPAGAPPGAREHVLALTRHRITLASQAAKKKLRTVMRNGRTYRIGIITVPSFYDDVRAADEGDPNARSTVHDVRRLLQQFAAAGGVDGLILDLRGDGGGYLPQAIGLTHLFINHGPVVQLRDSSGHIEVLDEPDSGQVYRGPLAVLVDRTSASASEIFAGAIQDYHRGLILGQDTFGKGTVQSVIPLDRWTAAPTEGQVTVTIGKFYRVTGQSTQLRGVTPDIILPSPISPKDVGEDQLPDAMPWDRIAATSFHPLPSDAALVRTLRAEQQAEARHSANYRWLLANISLLDTERHDRKLSLNLKTRERQRKQLNAQALAEDNARRLAYGLPALKAISDVNPAKQPDVVLNQAVDVMVDWVSSLRHQRLPETAAAQRSSTR